MSNAAPAPKSRLRTPPQNLKNDLRDPSRQPDVVNPCAHCYLSRNPLPMRFLIFPGLLGLFLLVSLPECDAAQLSSPHYQRPRLQYPHHKTISYSHLRPQGMTATPSHGPISYQLRRGEKLQHYKQSIPKRGGGRRPIQIPSRAPNPSAAGHLPHANSTSYRAVPTRQMAIKPSHVRSPVPRYR